MVVVRRNAVSDGHLIGVTWDYQSAKREGVKDPLRVVGDQWGIARSTVQVWLQLARERGLTDG